MDADGQHEAADLHKLFEPVHEGACGCEYWRMREQGLAPA